jgi:hypothetical protein
MPSEHNRHFSRCNFFFLQQQRGLQGGTILTIKDRKLA